MRNPLIEKLARYTRLSPDDRRALQKLVSGRTRQISGRRDIVREGEPPRHINLIIDGWACRYRELPDGRRQIVGFFLPGDLCDLNVYILRHMDHSVAALTPVTYAQFPRNVFENTIAGRPRLTQALWWETLVHGAIQREWLTSLGQRDAHERIAHLLCEIFLRLEAIGATEDNACPFPVTQMELAAATGLSAVHVNRTLQDLRAANLIVLRNRTLVVPDFGALRNVAMFDPHYLHLGREGSHLDANEYGDVDDLQSDPDILSSG